MKKLIPLTAYIEALGNSLQCSGTLSHLHLHPSQGDGIQRVGPHTIECDLFDTSRKWHLTLPTDSRFPIDQQILQSRVVFTHSCSLLVEAIFEPSTLTVYDSLGRPHQRDVLLEIGYTPLDDFMRQNCAVSRRSIVRNALESLHSAAVSLTQYKITHGALDRHTICFDDCGEVQLAGYPLAPLASSPTRDHESLAMAALLLYVGASDLTALRFLSHSSHNGDEHTRRLRCILSAAQHHNNTPLANIAHDILARASAGALTYSIARLSEHPFAPLPLLTPLLAGERKSSEFIFDTLQPLPAEDEVRVDFAHCDEVFPPSDTIIRYRKGNRWGYAYYDGQPIRLERQILSAHDFEEGRAVVITPRGYGLIDSSGKMVMNDVWRSLVWYCEENIVAAENDKGEWHIYDRMGHQISAMSADWMGDAAEGYVVARRGDKYCYYSINGARCTDFIYDEAYAFQDGKALVCYKGHHYYIDTTGHQTDLKKV